MHSILQLWLFRFALLFCSAWASSSYGATLHALIVTDTLDDDIGLGTAVDRELLHEEMVRIAYFADFNLSETFIDGFDFDPGVTLAAVKNLETQPDDIVVYFQCSHGFRTPVMQERWPALFFGWGNVALRLENITDILRAKPHRFTLVVADVCNNLVEEKYAPWLFPMYTSLSTKKLREMYRKLYKGSRGLVVAASAKPGQYAWIDDEYGSFFTLNFLDAFHECAHRNMCNWTSVLKMASERTFALCQSIEGLSLQEPQFAVELQ